MRTITTTHNEPVIYIYTRNLRYLQMSSEFSIRLAGTVLQVIGVILAIWSLQDVMVHFGQPSFWQILLNSLGRRRKRRVALKSGVFTTTSARGRLTVWTEDNPNLPLEKRMEGIIKNLKRVNSELSENARSIDKLQREYGDLRMMMVKENENTLSNIHSELESLHTGTFHKSFYGFVLIITGTIVSNMAPEFFGWIFE